MLLYCVFYWRRFRSSRVCGGIVFIFLAMRLALGLVSASVVSHRLVFASRLVLDLLAIGGFVFVLSYMSVSYIDRSCIITTF